MEIYLAVNSFSPPKDSSGYKVLGFAKGDRFEILESEDSRNQKTWWGARFLPSSYTTVAQWRDIPEDKEVIGFVPASYLKLDEVIHLRKLSDRQKLRRQSCLDLLKTMAKAQQKPSRDDIIVPPPDYEGAQVTKVTGTLLLQSGHAPPPAVSNMPKSPKLAPKSQQQPKQSQQLPKKAPTSPIHSPSIARNSATEYLSSSPRAASIDPRYLEDRTDPDEMVQPKKLANPCLESRERLDLHRELLFTQKRGIDLLNQKSELQKEIERRQEAGKKKEKSVHEKGKRNSFQIQLEKQAEKLKEYETQQEKVAEEEAKPEAEFLKAHARIKKQNLEGEQKS